MYTCLEHAILYAVDDLRYLDYNGEDYHFQNQCPYKCSYCEDEAKYKVKDS